MPAIDNTTLALILTGAGVTVAATIIASFVEVIKRAPIVGALVERNPSTTAFIGAAALVAYAYLATTPARDAANAFGAFLAFLGVAGLSGKAYDAGAAVKARVSG